MVVLVVVDVTVALVALVAVVVLVCDPADDGLEVVVVEEMVPVRV